MKLTQEKIIIGLGVWLAVLPFTGFPRSWKMVITVISGLAVVYVGALIWRKAKLLQQNLITVETKTGTFTETI
jgi:hypothetical protein